MEGRDSDVLLANPNSQSDFSSVNTTKDRKCLIIIILITLLLISISINIYIAVSKDENKEEKKDIPINKDEYHDYSFQHWNSVESLDKLKSYMKNITDPKSKNYIPIIDRVAVFDMDGTLYGEKSPTYLEYLFFQYFVANYKDSLTNTTEYEEISKRIDIYTANNSADVGDLEIDVFKHQAKAFKEWSIEETDKLFSEYFNKDIEVFNNLKFKDAFYKPMIEIINFLHANSFNVYVVSGTDRFIIRNLIYNHLNTDTKFNKDHCLGSDTEFIATGELPFVQEDVLADDHYVFQQNDTITRSGNGISKNLYIGKVRRIIREIGIQPVLGFGNSKGDVSMLNYVITNNKYQSKAFMIVADDIEREYGVDQKVDGVVDTSKSDELKEKWKSYNYQVISMRDDWKTIYGDNVTIKIKK